MIRHSPFSANSYSVLAAPPPPPPEPEVPFIDKPFHDQILEIVSFGTEFPAQDARWEEMWHQQDAAGNTLIRNQINSNGVFISKYGVNKYGEQGPFRSAQSDAAWQAYLNWLNNVDDGYSFFTYGGWDGNPAYFYGYGGWWYYVRKKDYFNDINLMG